VNSKTGLGLECCLTTMKYDGIWLYTFDSRDTAGLNVDAGLQYLCLCYGKFILFPFWDLLLNLSIGP